MSVLKSTVKIPLLVGSPLFSPWYVTISRGNQWWRRQMCVCVGAGEGTGYLRSNISAFHYLFEKWRAGRKTAFLPAVQRINHCPFGMYGTIRLVPSRYLCVFGVREDWGLGWGAHGVIHRQGWITFYACPWHHLFTCLARAKHSCKVKFLHLRPFFFQPSAKLIFVNANEGEILRIR